MMADGPNSRNPLVKSPQQWFVYGVLAVVIVAIVLRFGWLFSLPLTNDETSALMRLQVSGLDALLAEAVCCIHSLDLDRKRQLSTLGRSPNF